MSPRLPSQLHVALRFSLFVILSAPCCSLFADATAEMFQVSQVGQRNAAETRETLGIIYRDVAVKYDAKLKADLAAKGPTQTYKGERIRILRSLQLNNPDGDLYLCAYSGAPSVFQISGADLRGGQLSPPLATIAPAGDHTTVVTRIVKDPNASKGSGPALQKVDPDTGGGVTFFGIPVDTGSTSKPQGKGKAKSKPKAKNPSGTKEVKETRTMPKFTAVISTEKMEEGPPPMSQTLFVSMVKNGEIFTVKNEEQRRCQECRGFGRISDTRPPGKRSADGKMPCPECQGEGKINWNVTYKVGW